MDVAACISINSAVHVQPDLYVTNSTGNCYDIDYYLIDNTTNSVLYAKDLGCLAPGHYYPGPWIPISGHSYKSRAVETLNNGLTYSSTSPLVTYS
jgi:hypothetical protein